jgi:DNA-binding response OmpR family regulator
MPYPGDVGRAAYQLQPKVALPRPSHNRPGLAILSGADACSAPLLAACREQGIHYKAFSDTAALLHYAGRCVLSLVVVRAQAIDVPYRALLGALRSGGAWRVVLVGPSLGDTQYVQALEAGFDEVWPDVLPRAALPVLVSKAWQTARQMPHADAERVLTLGNLVLAAQSCSCWVAGHKVYLGRTCFAILQCLVLNYPGIASRGKLVMATREDDTAGLGDGSRAMDVSVSRLRKKLQEAGVAGVRIKSVSGLGYQLRMEFAEPVDTDHAPLHAASA